MSEAKWYILHTYTGYEKRVKQDIESMADSELRNLVEEIQIRMEEVVTVKNGKKVVTEKNKWPGYVLIKMIYDKDQPISNRLWWTIRNIPGVTGFLGTGGHPEALGKKDVALMGVDGNTVKVVVDFNVGDEVCILSGAWSDTYARVCAIDEARQKVKLMVDVFGRETPLELGFTDVKKKN